MKILRTITFWLDNARYNALPQSLFPALMALCFVSFEPTFSLGYALLAICGVLLAHLSMNLFDDYFDFKAKGDRIREKLAAAGVRARIAKCAYLTSGRATVRQLFVAASTFAALALLCGVFIWLKRGAGILYLTAAAGILGICYSGKPLKLSYRGLGEVVIALMFGPLLMFGVYFSASGLLSPTIVFASIPVGLLVANILYTHSIMDFEPDKRVGKMTLAVLLNGKVPMLAASAFFLFAPYLVLLVGILWGFLSAWYLLTWVTLPLAAALFWLMWQFVYHPQRTFAKRWWMQPLERWSEIQQLGLEWFMMRWFLARNLLIYFSVLMAVSLVLS